MKLKRLFIACVVLSQILIFGTILQHCSILAPMEKQGSLGILLLSLLCIVLLIIVGYGIYYYSNSKRLTNRTRAFSSTVAAIVLMIICYICNSITVLTKAFIELVSLEVCSCLLVFYIIVCERGGKEPADNENALT